MSTLSGEAPAEVASGESAPAPGTRAVWITAFLAFLLLPAAWALATPYNGSYDEHDHTVRAAGVVRGQILVDAAEVRDDGGYQRVPESLVPPNVMCLRKSRFEPATCLGDPPSSRAPVPVHTRASRYNPVYYAVVGLPLLPFPTMTGVILARLLSAALCALLLATAVTTLWPLRRHRLMMLALLFAATPILMALNGLINPSGLEISAAILLWAALLRLLAANGADGADGAAAGGRRQVVLAVVAGLVMVTVRPAGIPILLGVVGVAVVALGRRDTVRALLRRRDIQVGAAVLAVAAALAIGWSLLSRVGEVGAGDIGADAGKGEILRTILIGKFDYWLRGSIGLFGYGHYGLPQWIYVLWGTVHGYLALQAFVTTGSRRLAWTIAGIPVLCYAVGTAADFLGAPVINFWWQGRYFLPVWVGMLFLSAVALPPDALAPPVVRRLYVYGYAVWAIATALGLWITLSKFSDGEAERTFPGGWQPAVGMVPPVLLVVAGIGVTGWLVLRQARERSWATS